MQGLVKEGYEEIHHIHLAVGNNTGVIEGVDGKGWGLCIVMHGFIIHTSLYRGGINELITVASLWGVGVREG